MFEKIKSNQVFKSYTKKSAFLALIFSAFFVFSCTNNGMKIETLKIEKAYQQAEILSYEALVINAPKASEATTSSRGPASVSAETQITGSMGKDPWGNPFRYVRKTIRENSNLKTQIIVWSAGPNGVFDYDPESSANVGLDDVVYQHMQ